MNKRPHMKQASHPAHQMPEPQHDGTQLPMGGNPMPGQPGSAMSYSTDNASDYL